MTEKTNTYVIISKDRHRDDIVYIFKGKYEEAKKKAKIIFKEIRKEKPSESEYSDEEFLYCLSYMDGDYAVEVYKPVEIKQVAKGGKDE